MSLSSLIPLGGSIVALIPVYLYLFSMNRTLGKVEATSEHNAEHLERLNGDVDENATRLNKYATQTND